MHLWGEGGRAAELARLKTCRAELIYLIQENVNVRCAREHVVTFSQLKKSTDEHAKDLKNMEGLVADMTKRNKGTGNMISDRHGL